MTKSTDGSKARSGPRCRYCRKVFAVASGPGRKKEFCSQACRQWDWVGRQRARELQLSEDELVVARAELDALYDDLFVLSCAVSDTERELTAGASSARALREALDWLLDAARPLRDRTVNPTSPTGIPRPDVG